MFNRRHILQQLAALLVLPRAAVATGDNGKLGVIASMPSRAAGGSPIAARPSNSGFCFVQLTAEGAERISKRIEAKEAAWRTALGVPQGFLIPEPPLPATDAERRVKLAIVTELEHQAYLARLRLPPGPESESSCEAMVAYRNLRWRLMVALRGEEHVVTLHSLSCR